MNIVFIGGGNMGCALIGGLLKKGLDPSAVFVVEPSVEAREKLEKNFGVRTGETISRQCADSDIVVFAVKPQQFREVAIELAPMLDSQLVISIAAGIRSADLSNWLNGYERIVRAMPNTPAMVCSGVSGLYAMPQVDGEGRKAAETVLSSVGSVYWLDEESKMDALTAISGSGPAYVFYFIEAMHDAAVEMGFDAAISKKLSLETFAGAVKLAIESAEEPGLLRKKVTSKGGTTESAISSMERNNVKEQIVKAIRLAEKRSRELGEELGK